MMCVYDANSRTVESVGAEKVYDFFCGEELTELATLLVKFDCGDIDLQDTYTLLVQKLQPEHIDNMFNGKVW